MSKSGVSFISTREPGLIADVPMVAGTGEWLLLWELLIENGRAHSANSASRIPRHRGLTASVERHPRISANVWLSDSATVGSNAERIHRGWPSAGLHCIPHIPAVSALTGPLRSRSRSHENGLGPRIGETEEKDARIGGITFHFLADLGKNQRSPSMAPWWSGMRARGVHFLRSRD
jgi:hypothetical protein